MPSADSLAAGSMFRVRGSRSVCRWLSSDRCRLYYVPFKVIGHLKLFFFKKKAQTFFFQIERIEPSSGVATKSAPTLIVTKSNMACVRASRPSFLPFFKFHFRCVFQLGPCRNTENDRVMATLVPWWRPPWCAGRNCVHHETLKEKKKRWLTPTLWRKTQWNWLPANDDWPAADVWYRPNWTVFWAPVWLGKRNHNKIAANGAVIAVVDQQNKWEINWK